MSKLIKDPVKFNFISAAVTDGAVLFISFNFVAVYLGWRIFLQGEKGLLISILKIAGYWAAALVTVFILIPSAVSLVFMIIAMKMHKKGNIKGYRLFMVLCYAVMTAFSAVIILYSLLSMGGIMRILLAFFGFIILAVSVIGTVNTFSKRISSGLKGE